MNGDKEGMKDARKKKMGKRRKLVKTILEPFWISLPPPLHPPTIRKGRCSHRTVPANPAYHYPLTLHVSGPSIVLRAILTASFYPSCPSRPPSPLISWSLYPSIFSGSNPLLFDSRGAATPPSPPPPVVPRGGGNMAALAHWIH